MNLNLRINSALDRERGSIMTEPDEARLQRMDLSILQERDSYLDHEDDFDKKSKAHAGLMTSEDLGMIKPKEGPYFEIETNPGDKFYVSCHLPVPVLIINARCKKKTSLTKFDNLEEEYTWAMEEAAEWCKLHLTYDEIKVKNMINPLKVASDPEVYALSNYFEYLPTQVKSAEEKYKKHFVKKYEKTHTITTSDVTVIYRVFKCNTALLNS